MASDGTISACQDARCGHRCCDFSAGNYIVLYPGEVNHAVSAGSSVAHLEIRPASDGGHRAVCKACDTATCDGGYKPLDCASYPFFPTIEHNGDIKVGLLGAKCPLTLIHLAEHRAWVREKWSKLLRNHPTLWMWLRVVRLVGYQDHPERSPTTMNSGTFVLPGRD